MIITWLVFSGNRLEYIDNASFFQNVPELLALDLSGNDLRRLGDDAFQLLTKLENLTLKGNVYLNIGQFRHAIFSVKSLVRLDISDTYFGPMYRDTFVKYNLPNLMDLSVHNSAMRVWDVTMFQPLKSLQYVGMAANDLNSVNFTGCESTRQGVNISIVNLSGNDLYDFPESCLNGTKSVFPNLTKLFMQENRFKTLSKNICLPQLEWLELSKNAFENFTTGMFNETAFPNLQGLYLDRLQSPVAVYLAGVTSMEAYTFNNSQIQTLSIMYNNIDFSHGGVVHDLAFRGLTGLTWLMLEHNYGLIDGRLGELFYDSTNVTSLAIGNTFMNVITTTTFSRFPRLKRLELYHNPITVLPDGAFDSLKYLEYLDLSSCLILTLSQDVFSSATQHHLKHLDISGNIFQCDCHLLWFRDWLAYNDSHSKLFYNNYSAYQCHSPQKLRGTEVAAFRLQEQSCMMSHVVSTFIVIVTTFLIVLMTLVTFLYRYRWHIRLMLYETFRGMNYRLQVPADMFKYDVFVSYAEEDLPWVREHLLSRLEEGLGLRLCLHQRDFIPGQNIVDNIYHSVENSRKLLMVFSRPFARSHWCQFELAMCLQHVIDNDDALVIVCLDDVTSAGCGDLTATMMAVLHTTTYIQWADEWDAVTSFWARLKIALQEILPHQWTQSDRAANGVLGGVMPYSGHV